ncbi:MAG: trypsin-like peptidase domain-containing protein [Vicinamibacterales bacterium]
MSRRFTLLTVGLTSTVTFLVGLIVAGSFVPSRAVSEPRVDPAPPAARVATSAPMPLISGVVDFADVADRINPSVVNIDASSPSGEDREPRRRRRPDDWFDGPLGPEPDGGRQGAGSGFIIDQQGHILTNHHVIDGAERIVVTLGDGRTFRASVVGADPAIDVALIRVPATGGLPAAPLGDSTNLRVGEWVCAIGNPLGYVHSVTVGVVSFIGRKLFDASLDDYIQTDAAINFGNSGGPLINARGEVIGINSAISSRASNIGFAIPVNQARDVLPQLKAHGRVARGFIGVALKDVDPDLARSLALGAAHGALVQDVTAGSPGDRAGLRTYDLITAVDGDPVDSTDALIRRIAATMPGTTVRLELVRDGRPVTAVVKLAERRLRTSDEGEGPDEAGHPEPSIGPGPSSNPAGVWVRDLDRDDLARLALPRGLSGVLISRVEPLSPAFDADLERGQVVLEINREPIGSAAEFRRLLAGTRAGEPFTLYLYLPGLEQRELRTLRVDVP